MAGRVFAILVTGTLASAALTFFLANHERRQIVDHVRAFHSAERMIQIVGLLEAAPASAWPWMISALNKSGVEVEMSAAPAVAGTADPTLVAHLNARLGEERQIVAGLGLCMPGIETELPTAGTEPLCRSASISLKGGSYLHLWFPQQPDRPPTQSVPHWVLFVLLFVALLALLALLVTRMVTRPLRLLAAAATELGQDIERPALPEQGPSEVREAAAAFNLMQMRLRGFIGERTQMLAAITHDLQTPLTRLRLRLEQVADPELRRKLAGDLSAMQDMIRDGLDLARSLDSGEPIQRIDFDSLLNSVCDDAVETGQDVVAEGQTGAQVMGQPGGIRRCLTNLIENAVKYGGYARVSVSRDARKLVVRVRDGGPGIPVQQLEAVFAPFFRLENSRSRETGGSGIGLTIAHNIAEKHGGRLYLRNHAEGGLEAVLELPLP
jgi:signal transduction histidine kinase